MPPRAEGDRPSTLLPRSLARVARDVIACKDCARLRQYCARIGVDKRAAYRTDTYWAKPVPGFGDPAARIVIVGLAPAAHGANRTGRMFTGDGRGGSSDFLMTALHATGLASQPTSDRGDDGLTLTGAWMTAAVRCAPPDNRPTPAEIDACGRHLAAEVTALPQAAVFVALGRIAFDRCWRLLGDAPPRSRRPAFGHHVVVPLPGGRWLVGSYHPSRQNTHTGRLTPDMLAGVFARARDLAHQVS